MTYTPPAWTLEGDFDFNGTFETDLTPYVDKRQTIQVSRGLNAAGQYQVSRVTIGLDNRAGTFTPENSSSTLFGLLRPDVPVRLRATHAAIAYTLWGGYATRWRVRNFRVGEGSASLECSDLAGFLQRARGINVTLSTARDTDGALAAIMAAAGLAATDYSFDDGLQDLPYHWVRNQDASAAAMEAVRSEMGGYLFVQGDGRLRFENRQARLGTGADATWGDGTNIQPDDVGYELIEDDTITSAAVQATVLATGQANTVVLAFSRGMRTKPTADSIAIAGGGRYGPVEVDYQGFSALAALTTPEARVDYLGNTAANGSGTDKTSALTVTLTDLGAGARIQIDNTDAGTVYLTKFQVRGQPAGFVAETPNYVFTKSWPGVKALRGWQTKLAFVADTAKARDYAQATLRTYRYSYPRVTLPFAWSTDEIIAQMLSVELGWLVKFTDRASTLMSYVDDYWYVESIKHTVRPPGVGVCSSEVTLIPSYLYRDLDNIAYDLFTRSDAAGGLGLSTSDKAWADAAGFDIVGNAARPNSTAAQVPSLALARADMVVEASLVL